MVQGDQNAEKRYSKGNNAEAIQFHAPKLGVVEQLHTIKFHGNLKNECIACWFDMELPNLNVLPTCQSILATHSNLGPFHSNFMRWYTLKVS